MQPSPGLPPKIPGAIVDPAVEVRIDKPASAGGDAVDLGLIARLEFVEILAPQERTETEGEENGERE